MNYFNDAYNYGKEVTKELYSGGKAAIKASYEYAVDISTPHKDRDKSFCQIVEEIDLICDVYDVKTDDDYILKMFRVRTKAVAQMQKGQAPAVLL